MKKTRKWISLLCAMVMVFLLAAPAGAESVKEINQEKPLTEADLVEIEKTNRAVDAYMESLPSPIMRAAPKIVSLNVPLYQQETKYYCGATSAFMVASYLGILGSISTQAQMASLVKTTTDGSSSENIKNGLNTLLAASRPTHSYEVATTSTSSFNDSIIYTLDKGFPMIFSVKTMPEYTSGSGHFIVISGYKATGAGSNYNVQTVTINDCHWNNEFFGTYTYSMDEMTVACNSNAGRFIRHQ